jgi:DNA repair exonuclease SbcCD ATPase subunit
MGTKTIIQLESELQELDLECRQVECQLERVFNLRREVQRQSSPPGGGSLDKKMKELTGIAQQVDAAQSLLEDVQERKEAKRLEIAQLQARKSKEYQLRKINQAAADIQAQVAELDASFLTLLNALNAVPPLLAIIAHEIVEKQGDLHNLAAQIPKQELPEIVRQTMLLRGSTLLMRLNNHRRDHASCDGHGHEYGEFAMRALERALGNHTINRNAQQHNAQTQNIDDSRTEDAPFVVTDPREPVEATI